jgi:polar amino acid transport system permease protein
MTLTGRIANAEGRTDLMIPTYSYVLLWFFAYCYPIPSGRGGWRVMCVPAGA